MRLGSFLIGMGAGAAIAILFAPHSGEETREILSDTARQGCKFAERRARHFRRMASERAAELRDIAAERAKEIRNIAGERVDELKEIAMDAADKGREVIERHKGALSAAVEAAKDAYLRETQPS